MNFVLAIGLPDHTKDESRVDNLSVDYKQEIDRSEEIGLAYRDVTTGASFTRITTLGSLADDLALIDPKEIVLSSDLTSSNVGVLFSTLIHSVVQRNNKIMISRVTPRIDSSSFGYSDDSHEDRAAMVLTTYLTETLPTTPPPKIMAKHVDPSKILQMDADTLEALEIKTSTRVGIKGSLLYTVKRTITPGGARLLSERLCGFFIV